MPIPNHSLLKKLDTLARQQAPDNWIKLRRSIEQAEPRVYPVSVQLKRSGSTMKRQYRWLIAASAAVLVLILAFGLVRLLREPAAVDLSAGQTITLAKGKLTIHAITRTGGRIGMPPDAESVELALSDLPAIFGRDPIPDLPFDLKPEFDTISTLMFRSGTVFLMNGITYGRGDPAGPRVVFDLNDQGDLPLTDCQFGTEQESTWNGVALLLGVEQVETDAGAIEQYIARFVVHNIGYQIQATGLTGVQFLEILSIVMAG